MRAFRALFISTSGICALKPGCCLSEEIKISAKIRAESARLLVANHWAMLRWGEERERKSHKNMFWSAWNPILPFPPTHSSGFIMQKVLPLRLPFMARGRERIERRTWASCECTSECLIRCECMHLSHPLGVSKLLIIHGLFHEDRLVCRVQTSELKCSLSQSRAESHKLGGDASLSLSAA